jgi:hypothetical protein
VPRKITEKEIKNLVDDFKSGTLINSLVKSYGYTKATINKYLKKNINENEYKLLTKAQFDENDLDKEYNISNNQKSSDFESDFYELEPVDIKIDEDKQKDLSSVPLENINFPQVVYMIVDKNTELETKLLRDFPSWQFLPEEDLNRKTIEIYFDIKVAKRNCNKDKKVIKVPNTNVFKIAAPLLLSRGISRIVSEEQLIII